MSKVIVFGATGYAGSNITTELVSRGHDVQGVARRSPETAVESVSFITGSVHDAKTVRAAVTGADVIVLSLPARTPEDGGARLIDSLPAVIDAVIAAGARLGVVGGAGSLQAYEGGPLVMDLDTFPTMALPEARNHGDVLKALREAPAELDWFYLSPAGGFGSWNPGEHTGSFRLGGDILLTDETGQSNISGADYAIAFVDEIEKPTHSRQRFCVAY